jgi:hypothetical protein
MKRLKLVKDANKAWRWFSVQAMTIALALQAAWLALPPNLLAHMSAEHKTIVVIALLIFGMVGRLVDQGGEE